MSNDFEKDHAKMARPHLHRGLLYAGEGWERVLAMEPPAYPENVKARALAIFQNFLYLGTERMDGLEIWRSSDGVKWEACVGRKAATPEGFGNIQNSSVGCMLPQSSHLYVGTRDGMWRTPDGVTWEHIAGGPPAEITAITPFNNSLYVTCGGLRIWRWSEPGGWEMVVGPSPAPTKAGFGDADITDILTLQSLHGHLYAGAGRDTPSNPGISIWRSSNGTVWELFKEASLSLHVWALATFVNQLYVGGYDMLHIYRTAGSVSDWEEVTDGISVGSMKTGVWCLNECSGKLFAGLRGAEDFRMLWSSSDGKVWTAFNTSEIGERTMCDGVIAFGDYLYVTTRDTYPWMGWQEPRLEVWRYGAKYEPAPWLEDLDDLRPRVHPIGPLPPGR